MKHNNFSAYRNLLCNLQKNTCVSKTFNRLGFIQGGGGKNGTQYRKWGDANFELKVYTAKMNIVFVKCKLIMGGLIFLCLLAATFRGHQRRSSAL